MPQPISRNTDSAPASLHYDLLKSRLPAWYSAAATHRQQALAEHSLTLPTWYRRASHGARTALLARHGQYHATLNRIDRQLGAVQDIMAFAEPLLTQAIQNEFGLALDVRQVFFARKYGFKGRDDLFGALVFERQDDPASHYLYRGISLLEAALANFAPEDEQTSACHDCRVITRWSSYDGAILADYAAVSSQAVALAPEAFAGLCRRLDLGRRYQEHLQSIVLPPDAQARTELNEQLREHHRQLLTLSTEIGGLQGAGVGIGSQAYQMLQQWLRAPGEARLDGRAVVATAFKVLDVELIGPLLLGPAREGSERVERVLAYLPGDPQQPFKEYASSAEFMADLRTRLHSGAYRRFFSRFIPVREQGRFFERFNRLYQPAEQSDATQDYPLGPRPAALPMTEVPLVGDLWQLLAQRQVNKVFADARVLAVPTGDEDRQARLERLAGFLNAAQNVFMLAAFVVPVLGPLLLAVGAAQMLDEAFEGIEAFEDGDLREMWAHLSSVALNVAFIAAGSAVLPAIHSSPKVDNLRPVERPNGQARLWHPDLAPYAREVPLVNGAQPDEQGLHRVNGQAYLALEGRLYGVTQEPLTGRYRIQHPTRPDAYQPLLRHNGTGAWSHELEQPRTWQGSLLMRRLGHRVAAFSDAQLEQLRRIGGFDEGLLRRLHAEGEPLPPLLADQIARFESARQIDAFIDAIGSDVPSLNASADPMTQLHILTQYGQWPRQARLQLLDASGEPVWRYAEPQALPDTTREVQLWEAQVRSPDLLRHLLDAMDRAGVRPGFEGDVAGAPMEARVAHLREKIATLARQQKVRLFNDHYASLQAKDGPRVDLLMARFPLVPAAVVKQLLSLVSPAEELQMAAWDFTQPQQTKPVPLRLAEALRLYQREVRLNRAYEGLYLDYLASADTRRLQLATLQTLPGWSASVRIELRADEFSGPLRASAGPGEARFTKVLVEQGGRYKAYDAQENELCAWTDFYQAVQHALPDSERLALGVPSVHQGAELGQRVLARIIPRGQAAQVLGMQPLKAFFKPPLRLDAGRVGYPLSGGWKWWRAGSSVLRGKVLELYPDFSPAQVDALLQSLGRNAQVALQRLAVEFQQLTKALDQWAAQRLMVEAGEHHIQIVPDGTKQEVVRRIKACWRQQGRRIRLGDGQLGGFELDLNDLRVGQLPDLSANFSHVASLKLRNMGLTHFSCEAFLSGFPQLRWLDMMNNGLRVLPAPLASMRQMTRLYLTGNRMVLTASSAQTLAGLTQLKILNLARNPLGVLPDFSPLSDLLGLDLHQTGIDVWPVGLRGQALEALDLRDNQIAEIPDYLFTPPAEEAEAIIRINRVTFLQRNPINEASRQQLLGYWPRVEQQYPQWVQGRLPATFTLGEVEPTGQRGTVARWLNNLSGEDARSKTALWDALRREPGADEFFELLQRLGNSYVDAESYPDLQARIWQMLEAAEQSTQLRTRLFEQAGEPACEDRAALSFSSLEITLMVHNATLLSAVGEEGEQLYNLAKGLFRLDEVESIALRDIQQRRDAITTADLSQEQQLHQLARIEEVEVRLAYRVGLRERLQLPGQPKSFRFHALANVTNAMLDAAQAQVSALEGSEVQLQSIVGRDFWVEFIQTSHRPAFDALNESFLKRQTTLDEQYAGTTLSEDDYQRQSQDLELQLRVEQAQLLVDLTRAQIETIVGSTDL